MSASSRKTTPPGRTRVRIGSSICAPLGMTPIAKRVWTKSKEAAGSPLSKASPSM